MDIVNSIQNDNLPSKFEPPHPDVRSSETADDGYETSNGGDAAATLAQPPGTTAAAGNTTAQSPDTKPEAMNEEEADPGEQPKMEADGNSNPGKLERQNSKEAESATSEASPNRQDSQIDDKLTAALLDEEEKNERQEESLTAEDSLIKECVGEIDKSDVRSVGESERVASEFRDEVVAAVMAAVETNSAPSNSPKQTADILNPNDDSCASARDQATLSPCPSNSRSNSSLGASARQAMAYDGGENLTMGHNLMPQEDSSSQSYGANLTREQMNAYDMKQRMNPAYNNLQAPRPDMPFGGIKREPYNLVASEHDPYAHYKRDSMGQDPYARDNMDPYGRSPYKRPEEMFMGYKEEMPYGGFGIKREMQQNPYSYGGIPTQYPFSGGMKRDSDGGDLLSYNGGGGGGGGGIIKRECGGDPSDPYSFVDEEAAVCAMLGQAPPSALPPHMDMQQPKKRGRKKKIKDECMEMKQEAGLDGMLVKPVKERKKHDRFNGMPEEEVCRRTLPDHLAQNLDIIIIGINPGLFAAYKGHHYAGPGNHFWKCLYLSGLTQEQMSADEDYKLLHFGIGFTNMVQRATKGSADLTRKEIKEGSQVLLEKLQTFRPKIAVFNGKLIYEVFSGKKDFCFGRQPDTVHGTNTYMWVMPSSSARCAQLPRAADKVPFYSALRRFRDYLNGQLPHVDDAELVFPDTTCRRPQEDNEIRRLLGPDVPCEMMVLEDGTEVPLKKKRGRPKKVKLENGEVAPPSTPRAPRPPKQPVECLNGEVPAKKKRGRPKKVRPEDSGVFNSSNVASGPMGMGIGLNMDSGSYQSGILSGGGRDYQSSALDASNNQMLGYQGNNAGGQIGTAVPATSPYYAGNLNANAELSPDLENQQMMSGGPGTPIGGLQRNQGFGHSPGPFSQSPRPQGVSYGSSPRPAGYSQSPQRHQSLPASYSNSPVQNQGNTHPYSQSPVPQNQNAQYSQSPPLRPRSQNYSQPSPIPTGHPYSRSPVPQNNPTYSQQSPMFAQSPVNPYSQSPVPQNQVFSQPSPASQSMAYACRSPAPMSHSYPQSPLQQGASYPQLSPAQSHPYSQSPIPQNTNLYTQSPNAQNYQTSNVHSRGHPYSPVGQNLPHHPGYGQSPLHQSQARQNPTYPGGAQNMTMNSNPNPTMTQQYHSDLSSEISAAISSPGPASPSIGHLEFEPPMIDNHIAVQENETNSSSRSVSQRTSPGGEQNPTDMRQNSNINSEAGINAMGDVSHQSSHDSNDIMDNCTNTMLQMAGSRQNITQNRHSALNLIGPSNNSNTSSPGLEKTNVNTNNIYNSMYAQPGSNEAQSPVSNEQRLGFQVPTPSGSANSSYGTGTPTAADLSNVARNSPRDVDNASVASVSSQQEQRLMGSGSGTGYPGISGYPAEAGGSPRQNDGGLLAHHAAAMYGNPFTRIGSTPPSHHTLSGSPFSSQSGAFRGLPIEGQGSSPQASGPSGDYGSPVKPTTTKQQDVSSKSLSGLESLVDQIPSIADGGPSLSTDVPSHSGPAPVPALENPYATHAPSIYTPYPYQPTPYGPPSNNGYPSPLTASGFVGYASSPYGQLMRPTPAYLPDALSAYHPAHHSGYPGLPSQQYGPTAGYGPATPTPNYSYYNGYGPGSIPNAASNMPTYLSTHVLDHIHKNAAADASSVSFGGFC